MKTVLNGKVFYTFPKEFDSDVIAICGDDMDKAWKLAELISKILTKELEEQK